MASLSIPPQQPEPLTEWLKPSLQDTAGQDPLGFNTITLDRVLPQLIPGILQLSERARYFSIYPWILLQFEQRRRAATAAELDIFIRRREYELCLAMQVCPNCRAAKAIGSQSAGPAARSGADPLERGLSVESEKGGFGLYYRSPLVELGAVAAVGTPLGDEGHVTPVEVLHKNERARAPAEEFHRAIEGTEYFKRYERNDEPIPRQVLEELAEQVCLCRLRETSGERDAVRRLLFTAMSAADAEPVEARRRAFAFYLTLVADNPDVTEADGEFWRGAIHRFLEDPTARTRTGETVAAWAALAMKECLQDAVCSIWTDFCRTGVERQGSSGFSMQGLRGLIRDLIAGLELAGANLAISPDDPARAVSDAAVEASSEMDWEDVRAWSTAEDSASAGLVALMIFAERLPDPAANPIWAEIAGRHTDHQNGLLGVTSLLRRRLEQDPSFAELLDWSVRQLLIAPHEVIAYSKLPRSTFRFSWDEGGRMHFYTPGTGGLDRFAPSDDRRAPLTSLTEDVGLWETQDGAATLTQDGADFVAEVLG